VADRAEVLGPGIHGLAAAVVEAVPKSPEQLGAYRFGQGRGSAAKGPPQRPPASASKPAYVARKPPRAYCERGRPRLVTPGRWLNSGQRAAQDCRGLSHHQIGMPWFMLGAARPLSTSPTFRTVPKNRSR
jgi:hypothetical protein